MPHQTIMELGPRFENRGMHHPVHGRNGPGVMQNSGPEKNWIWFLEPGVRSQESEASAPLRMIYSITPHEVVAVTRDGQVAGKWRTEHGREWKLGPPRGGTPPVRARRPGAEGPEYLSFFHSSTPWSGGKNRYFMGAYTFEAQAPYRVTAMTREPLLVGSTEDPMLPWSPPVVFPSGLMEVGAHWLVSLGVNDAACAWIKIPQADLWKRMA